MPVTACPGCGRDIPIHDDEVGKVFITCAACEARFLAFVSPPVPRHLEDHPPPRTRWPVGLVVAGAILFVALGVVGLIALAANVGGRQDAPADKSASPAKPIVPATTAVWDQDDLRRKLMQTNWDGALRLLGKAPIVGDDRLVFEVTTRRGLLGGTNRFVHVLFPRRRARTVRAEDVSDMVLEAGLNPPRVIGVEFRDDAPPHQGGIQAPPPSGFPGFQHDQ